MSMTVGTKHVVEGLNPDGSWVEVGLAINHEDPLAQRDSVVRKLRDFGITRYSKIRLAKYVTTIEVVGEDIRV
jgi:hypothetical protein